MNVKEVEDKWLENLFEHCKDIFSPVAIPSHNHNHHLRVWQYAKGIAEQMQKAGEEVSDDLLEVLIVSVFFHDTGLVQNSGHNHGKDSRQICEQYFTEHPENIPCCIEDILELIEIHDDKEYNAKVRGDLLSKAFFILSAADDLDAYGAVGVYRYLEIYLMRGISKAQLAQKVLDNLNSRWTFFEKTFSAYPQLIAEHKSRFEYTKRYFQALVKNEDAALFILEAVEKSIQQKAATMEVFCDILAMSNYKYMVNFLKFIE